MNHFLVVGSQALITFSRRDCPAYQMALIAALSQCNHHTGHHWMLTHLGVVSLLDPMGAFHLKCRYVHFLSISKVMKRI